LSTIYGSQTVAITLSSAFQSVTLDADIIASGEDAVYLPPNSNTSFATTLFSAVYGPKSTDFTIVNELEIASSAASTFGSDAGILLGTLGSVVNDGEISAQNGIIILGRGVASSDIESRVENESLIDASAVGIYLTNAGSVTNSGTLISGTEAVILGHGGYVSNTGTMSGRSGIYASTNASSELYDKGTYLFNGGTINATGVSGWGAYAVGPQAVISNVGVINTKWQGIVLNSYGATYNFGAVYNSGEIGGGNFGIESSRGGYVLNSGTIESSLYSADKQNAPAGLRAGTISLPTGFGIAIGQGATAVNTGTIDGMAAVYLQYGGGSIVNSGSIHGVGDGIFMRTPGTLSNQGTITAATGVFSPGGIISNTGVISGYGNGYGVMLDGGGTITNTGTVSGGLAGILSYGGTVITSGFVGGERLAIKFRPDTQGENASRLIIEPGAAFGGGVSGGGASLELAAGATNPNIVTFGTTAVYGFTEVTIDSGAIWTLAGNVTLDSVANYGTIFAAAGSEIVIDNESGSGQIDTLQGTISILSNAALNLSAGLTFLTPDTSATSTYTPDFPIIADSASPQTLKPSFFTTSISVQSISHPINSATLTNASAMGITLQS